MSGSLGDVNFCSTYLHGRNLRRKPKWDFIPRYPGKLYSDQGLRHSTPTKVHSVLLSRVHLLDQVSPRRTLFSCKYLSSFLAIALLSYSNWEQLFAKVSMITFTPTQNSATISQFQPQISCLTAFVLSCLSFIPLPTGSRMAGKYNKAIGQIIFEIHKPYCVWSLSEG